MISKFCIRHRVTTLLAVIMISIFGVVFATQLQTALLPNMSVPAAYVFCYYNGAGPEDMEQLVTRPLEGAIMSVAGVEEITSSSADSMSTVQITTSMARTPTSPPPSCARSLMLSPCPRAARLPRSSISRFPI